MPSTRAPRASAPVRCGTRLYIINVPEVYLCSSDYACAFVVFALSVYAKKER